MDEYLLSMMQIDRLRNAVDILNWFLNHRAGCLLGGTMCLFIIRSI